MARRKPKSNRPMTQAPPPPTGFYEPPASAQRRIETIIVDDPMERPRVIETRPGVFETKQPKIAARANTAGDILETYRKRGTITYAEYAVGRLIEDVIAWSNPSAGGQWRDGDRVDAASAHEWAIAQGVDQGNAAVMMSKRLDEAVGPEDRMVLIQVLVGGLSFAELAAFYTKRDQLWAKSEGEEVAAYVNRRVDEYAFVFRRALRNVAMKWVTARGAPTERKRDQYDAIATRLAPQMKAARIERQAKGEEKP